MKSFKAEFSEAMSRNPDAKLVEGEELRRLQLLLLEMYLDVQQACEDRGLTCMLLGGSTLGAVRHKGFIPWDDDLDLAMPRDDYERFKEIFKDKLGDKYILNAPNYEGRPTNRFPKILKRGTTFVEIGVPEDDRACVKIDIFVLDNVPDNRLMRMIKGLHCTALMFAGGHVLDYENARITGAPTTGRERIGRLLAFRSDEKWFDRFDKVCRCRNNRSKEIGIPSGRKHYFGEILPREVYLPVSEGEFEGHRVTLPGNTDPYLRNLYGNYMEIPPEEKREKHYIEKIEF